MRLRASIAGRMLPPSGRGRAQRSESGRTARSSCHVGRLRLSHLVSFPQQPTKGRTVILLPEGRCGPQQVAEAGCDPRPRALVGPAAKALNWEGRADSLVATGPLLGQQRTAPPPSLGLCRRPGSLVGGCGCHTSESVPKGGPTRGSPLGTEHCICAAREPELILTP